MVRYPKVLTKSERPCAQGTSTVLSRVSEIQTTGSIGRRSTGRARPAPGCYFPWGSMGRPRAVPPGLDKHSCARAQALRRDPPSRMGRSPNQWGENKMNCKRTSNLHRRGAKGHKVSYAENLFLGPLQSKFTAKTAKGQAKFGAGG